MQVTIQLLSSAINDLLDARRFYEQQRNGLGAYFFDSIFADIDKLTLYAGCHPKYFGYYRMLAKKFPYAIYYKMNDTSVAVVWRILDMRRSPYKIKQLLP
uniref:Type II toxin-antitoxin system RelE/ParE family toxin n=1 Tax=Chlorobium chlorochromatii (strain CaD3) TaxID=340177 RepID=Q3AP32_CHLCH